MRMWRILKRLSGPGAIAGMVYNPDNKAAGALGGVLGAGTTSLAIPGLIKKLGPALPNGALSDAVYGIGGLLSSPIGVFGGGYLGSKFGAAVDRKFGSPLAARTKKIEDWVADKVDQLVL